MEMKPQIVVCWTKMGACYLTLCRSAQHFSSTLDRLIGMNVGQERRTTYITGLPRLAAKAAESYKKPITSADMREIMMS